MKILFLYPPASYLDMPSLGIACLQAYLRATSDVTTDVWDVNLGFFDYLMKPETIGRTFAQIRAENPTDSVYNELLSSIEENLELYKTSFYDETLYYDNHVNDVSQKAVHHIISAHATFEPKLKYIWSRNGLDVRFKDAERPFSLSESIGLSTEGSYHHFDAFLRAIDADTLQRVRSQDVIGISCANPQQIYHSFRLSTWLRSIGFTGKIILGGSFVTRARRIIEKDPRVFDLVDVAVTFEGEEALGELIVAIREGRSIESIPNLMFAKDHRVVSTPARKIQNIDVLPTPDFSGYDIKRYLTPEPVMPIYASRGCYYDVCSFCNHHENYFGGYRVRTPKTVHEDMQAYQARYGCTKFFFVDEISSPKYQSELCTLNLDQHGEFKWYVHARVDPTVAKEDLELFSKGGVTLLHVGVESSNTKVLDLMNKGYAREDVERFLSLLSQVPLTAHLNTIQNFPGETPEDYLETLRDMYEYAKVGDIVHLYEFGLLDNSLLHREGSPHISRMLPSENDLMNHIDFEFADKVEPTMDEAREIDALRWVLSKNIAVACGLFPQDLNWAAHLLFICRYRAHGLAHLIDTPLKDLTSPALDLFKGENWINAHFLIVPGLKQVQGTLINPRTLGLHSFEPEFLERLSASADGVLEPGLFPAAQFSREKLKEDLYKLYKMGAIRHKGAA